MDLQDIRERIDQVDSDMIDLILKRKELVLEIAEYKKDNRIPVNAPEREREVLDRLTRRFDAADAGISSGLRLMYGILMDINKLNEYRLVPKDLKLPTGLGGASVRAVLSDSPSALSRYLSPLAAAEVSISNIRAQSLPGGKLLVDIELVGDMADQNFAAALSVLSDTAEKFTLV